MSVLWALLFCAVARAGAPAVPSPAPRRLDRPYWKQHSPRPRPSKRIPKLYWKKHVPRHRVPEPAGPRLDRLYWKR